MKNRNILQLDLNLLKVFDAIYTHNNLTRAGDSIGMTQPAVSHALRRLRLAFKDELFIRTPDGMVPTSHANEIAFPISRSLHEVDSALSPSHGFDPAMANDEFCIAVNNYGSLLVIPKLIKEIRRTAPNVRIRTVQVGTFDNPSGHNRILYTLLDSGEVDLAISLQSEHPPRFNEELIYNETAVCIVSKKNRLVGDKMDLKTYLKLGHAKLVVDSEHQQTPIDTALARIGKTRQIVVTIPHLLSVIVTIAETDLVATVPRQVLKSLGPMPGIKILELPFEDTMSFVVQLWHQRRNNDPSFSWLRRTISGSCSITGT